MITAKVFCASKNEYGEGDDRQADVMFGADYADDRNKEWAKWTPALNLTMKLNGQAADLFEQGKKYTLQFVEDAVAQSVAADTGYLAEAPDAATHHPDEQAEAMPVDTAGDSGTASDELPENTTYSRDGGYTGPAVIDLPTTAGEHTNVTAGP